MKCEWSTTLQLCASCIGVQRFSFVRLVLEYNASALCVLEYNALRLSSYNVLNVIGLHYYSPKKSVYF
ncbi:MAG: hypothetical protein KAI83_14040 [Thiomargarita sp.]|nr:hypothetical protein [Thiomargarita sp.]